LVFGGDCYQNLLCCDIKLLQVQEWALTEHWNTQNVFKKKKRPAVTSWPYRRHKNIIPAPMTVVISTMSRNGTTNYQHVQNHDTWCGRWKFVSAL
jgi:hypothetical protein